MNQKKMQYLPSTEKKKLPLHFEYGESRHRRCSKRDTARFNAGWAGGEVLGVSCHRERTPDPSSNGDGHAHHSKTPRSEPSGYNSVFG